ncbi:MAG: winged helix-turn-helix transcriptional regulator [Dehalococcoidales bacterium]
MVKILQNKKLATVFQILVEIAANQPNIPQKVIASKIGVTPQAVSEYIRELTRENYLEISGRSRYRVSQKGVNLILKMAAELEEYSAQVAKAVTKISIATALAIEKIVPGQKVPLFMRDGLLYAGGTGSSNGAWGIAASRAKHGEDVGITNLEGIVELEAGEITIAIVPGIERGGSAMVDRRFLKKLARGKEMVAAIGLEALSALRKIGVEPGYRYAARQAAIEAAQTGLSPLIVCVDSELSNLVNKLAEENISYRTLNLERTTSNPKSEE